MEADDQETKYCVDAIYQLVKYYIEIEDDHDLDTESVRSELRQYLITDLSNFVDDLEDQHVSERSVLARVVMDTFWKITDPDELGLLPDQDERVNQVLDMLDPWTDLITKSGSDLVYYIRQYYDLEYQDSKRKSLAKIIGKYYQVLPSGKPGDIALLKYVTGLINTLSTSVVTDYPSAMRLRQYYQLQDFSDGGVLINELIRIQLGLRVGWNNRNHYKWSMTNELFDLVHNFDARELHDEEYNIYLFTTYLLLAVFYISENQELSLYNIEHLEVEEYYMNLFTSKYLPHSLIEALKLEHFPYIRGYESHIFYLSNMDTSNRLKLWELGNLDTYLASKLTQPESLIGMCHAYYLWRVLDYEDLPWVVMSIMASKFLSGPNVTDEVINEYQVTIQEKAQVNRSLLRYAINSDQSLMDRIVSDSYGLTMLDLGESEESYTQRLIEEAPIYLASVRSNVITLADQPKVPMEDLSIDYGYPVAWINRLMLESYRGPDVVGEVPNPTDLPNSVYAMISNEHQRLFPSDELVSNNLNYLLESWRPQFSLGQLTTTEELLERYSEAFEVDLELLERYYYQGELDLADEVVVLDHPDDLDLDASWSEAYHLTIEKYKESGYVLSGTYGTMVNESHPFYLASEGLIPLTPETFESTVGSFDPYLGETIVEGFRGMRMDFYISTMLVTSSNDHSDVSDWRILWSKLDLLSAIHRAGLELAGRQDIIDSMKAGKLVVELDYYSDLMRVLTLDLITEDPIHSKIVIPGIDLFPSGCSIDTWGNVQSYQWLLVVYRYLYLTMAYRDPNNICDSSLSTPQVRRLANRLYGIGDDWLSSIPVTREELCQFLNSERRRRAKIIKDITEEVSGQNNNVDALKLQPGSVWLEDNADNYNLFYEGLHQDTNPRLKMTDLPPAYKEYFEICHNPDFYQDQQFEEALIDLGLRVPVDLTKDQACSIIKRYLATLKRDHLKTRVRPNTIPEKYHKFFQVCNPYKANVSRNQVLNLVQEINQLLAEDQLDFRVTGIEDDTPTSVICRLIDSTLRQLEYL